MGFSFLLFLPLHCAVEFVGVGVVLKQECVQEQSLAARCNVQPEPLA